MLGAALFAIALLAACKDDASSSQEVMKALSAPAARAYSAPTSEYSVAGHVLRLVVAGETCIVEHRAGKSQSCKLTLHLRPPCYLLTWRQPPPRIGDAGGLSDGLPIGAVGDPMAWRYASADAAVALAVIGDPIPDELREGSLYQLRQQQGLHCASSVQGILLRAKQIQLSEKREHAGLFCAELGLEEKDFWMLAHP